MNYLEDPRREALLDQVLGARSLAEIAAARQALRRWVQEHPDDLGIVDGFEALATMEECAGEEAGASSQPLESVT